jgi:hypothetical protein
MVTAGDDDARAMPPIDACLTYESAGRTNLSPMITASRTPFDNRVATGRYSPARSYALLGQFVPVVSIDF